MLEYRSEESSSVTYILALANRSTLRTVVILQKTQPHAVAAPYVQTLHLRRRNRPTAHAACTTCGQGKWSRHPLAPPPPPSRDLKTMNNTINRRTTTTCGIATCDYVSGCLCLARFGRRGGGGAIQGKRARFGPVMKAACFSSNNGNLGDVAE